MKRIARVLSAALLVTAVAAPAAAEGAAGGADPLAIEWVSVAGGGFMMGSDERSDEKPPHQVHVRDFTIARTEVTQRLWRAVMDANPSSFAGCDECPVENVSWEMVQEFFAKYREKTGVALRLPTEAEWEYAAGGGSVHQKWSGTNAIGALGEFAWMDRNSGGKTQPVAQKKPNGLGLHDMSGNAAEWVADWYDPEYYKTSPSDNPTGPAAGERRVARGGSWWFSANGTRTPFRLRFAPGDTSWMLGFRPVRQ